MYAKAKAISIRAAVHAAKAPLILAALCLLGCDEREGAEAGTAAAAPPAAASPAPEFVLEDLSGEPVSLSGFRGKSNVLLHFGATWCPPCREQVGALNELAGMYGREELVVLSVHLAESAEVVKAFESSVGARYASLLDPEGSVGAAYGVQFIPLNVLVDTQGRVVGRPGNAVPWEAIRELVGR